MTQHSHPFTPRKLPQQKRAIYTLNVILESAAHILESSGFDGYNTNAIAAKAGVSIGSLYQYFGNKEGITKALIVTENNTLLQAINAASTISTPDSAMKAMILAAVNHQLARPQLARILDIEEYRLYRSGLSSESISELLQLAVLDVVERCYGQHPQLSVFCTDIIAITRALCEAAGARQEVCQTVLQDKINKTVHCYLREQFNNNAS